MAQTTNDPVMEAILKQYESNSTKSTGKKTYDLKNYFSTYLQEGVKTGTKTIRILPAADGGTPFKEIHVHTYQVNGQWKKFPCLKHNFGKECAFCEAREKLLATGKDSDKELAKKFGSRKMYVLRVIDRDHEDDGIKFWRFNHDYRNQGTFDKLISIIKRRGNVTDLVTGRDIIIDMQRDQMGKTIISGIIDADPLAASEDASTVEAWMADTRTWEDVYSIKGYDYLEIIVKGGEPTWSTTENGWVDKLTAEDTDTKELASEITMGDDAEKANAEVKVEVEKKVVAKEVVSDEEEDDLPF